MRGTFLGLAATTALAFPAYAAEKDIVDTAVDAGSFGTLAAAVKAATPWDLENAAGAERLSSQKAPVFTVCLSNNICKSLQRLNRCAKDVSSFRADDRNFHYA